MRCSTYSAIALIATALLMPLFIASTTAQPIEDRCRQQPHRSCVTLIAFDTVQKQTHPFHVSGSLSFLAPAIAKLGQVKDGLALASSIPEAALQAVAIARIAEVTRDDALFDQANIILQKLTTEDQKNLAKQGVAEALARAGQTERAAAIAETMPPTGFRTRVYSYIAAYEEGDRHMQKSLELLRAAPVILKASGLSRIAARHNNKAIADEAVTAARDAKNKSESAQALAEIAYILGDYTLITEAAGMAKNMPIGTRLVIAQLQASLGDIAPAFDIILPVPDIDVRAYILSNIAFNMR
ncbi:MAG: hypothetical protein ACK4FJ_08750 [Ferrovibrio sp.]|uniref:hypothetical protein n=1 Tax=Ferrovibrio sp. TaxID=1917215 RepID=UPI0039194C07